MIRTLKEREKLFENKRFLALDGFMKNTQTKAQESFAVIKCEPSWKEPLMVFETAPDYVKDVDLALTELAEIKQRAEEAKKEYETAIKETDGTYIQTVLKAVKEEKLLLIDYILKGEKK